MLKEQPPPTDMWPGTEWEQIKDVFLLQAGNTYAAGSTGGEPTHTLTVNEMPSHYHTTARIYNNWPLVEENGKGGSAYGYNIGSISLQTRRLLITDAAGSSQAHNNMPPYLTVYGWKRVA